MIPAAGSSAAGAAVAWVLTYWRTLVLRGRVIEALKLKRSGLYERLVGPIRSAPILDRMFATSEVVAAESDHEALLLNRNATTDPEIRALQASYQRWCRLLFGFTAISLGVMLLVVWLSWR